MERAQSVGPSVPICRSGPALNGADPSRVLILQRYDGLALASGRGAQWLGG